MVSSDSGRLHGQKRKLRPLFVLYALLHELKLESVADHQKKLYYLICETVMFDDIKELHMIYLENEFDVLFPAGFMLRQAAEESRELTSAIVHKLKHEKTSVGFRIAALYALSGLLDEEDFCELFWNLSNTSSPRIREEISELFGICLSYPTVNESCYWVINNPTETTQWQRMTAAGALAGRFDYNQKLQVDPMAHSNLIAALDDPKISVAFEALESLCVTPSCSSLRATMRFLERLRPGLGEKRAALLLAKQLRWAAQNRQDPDVDQAFKDATDCLFGWAQADRVSDEPERVHLAMMALSSLLQHNNDVQRLYKKALQSNRRREYECAVLGLAMNNLWSPDNSDIKRWLQLTRSNHQEEILKILFDLTPPEKRLETLVRVLENAESSKIMRAAAGAIASSLFQILSSADPRKLMLFDVSWAKRKLQDLLFNQKDERLAATVIAIFPLLAKKRWRQRVFQLLSAKNTLVATTALEALVSLEVNEHKSPRWLVDHCPLAAKAYAKLKVEDADLPSQITQALNNKERDENLDRRIALICAADLLYSEEVFASVFAAATTDSDPAVRRYAQTLLACCPELFPDLIDALGTLKKFSSGAKELALILALSMSPERLVELLCYGEPQKV